MNTIKQRRIIRLANQQKDRPAPISCICTMCGYRNDHSTDNATCKKDHDSWLELRDIITGNEFFKKAVKHSRLTADDLFRMFIDRSVLHIPFKPYFQL